jgi:pilus assembly protein CpaF
MSRITATPREANTAAYSQLRSDLHKSIVESLDLSRLDRWPKDRLRAEIDSVVKLKARETGAKLNNIEQTRLTTEILDEIFGLGPIEELFRDKSITEVLVNGPFNVYVEREGTLEKVGVTFTDNAHLIRIIQRLAGRVGRRIDESSPMLDARLADGSRVNAVFPPLTLDGPVLSIRRFGQILTHEDLINRNAMPAETLGFLRAAVGARANILISGGTGAGKTTMLNILASFIPKEQRIVTIEDAVELKLPLPHVVRMETRVANVEGQGQITQHELVRNSLRMRPDRIIVGEVRGREALDMLQAMNTGHEGSLTTIHANDTRDALSRLEMMVGMSGFEVPVPVLRSYISKAINVVIQLSRLAGGERKLVRVSEMRGLNKHGRYVLKDLFVFEQSAIVNGRAVGQFKSTGVVPKLLKKLHSAGYELPADLFSARVLETQQIVEEWIEPLESDSFGSDNS